MTTDYDRGPWDNEPTSDQWVDEATGLLCVASREAAMGHWCGYVRVPDGHPWHGVEYDDLYNVEVHGGLTYADALREKPSGEWWLGFDCAHRGDIVPGLRYRGVNDVWRDLPYVRAECARLAQQIAEAAS